MSSFSDSDKVYILGDFNINLFESNAHVKAFEETYMCNGFNPLSLVVRIISQTAKIHVLIIFLLEISISRIMVQLKLTFLTINPYFQSPKLGK